MRHFVFSTSLLLCMAFSKGFASPIIPTDETAQRLMGLPSVLTGLILEHAPASTLDLRLTCKEWNRIAQTHSKKPGSRFNIQTKVDLLRTVFMTSLDKHLDSKGEQGLGKAIADLNYYCDFVLNYADRVYTDWRTFSCAQKTAEDLLGLSKQIAGETTLSQKVAFFDLLLKLSLSRSYVFISPETDVLLTESLDLLTPEQTENWMVFSHYFPRHITVIGNRVYFEQDLPDFDPENFDQSLYGFFQAMALRIGNLKSINNRSGHYVLYDMYFSDNKSTKDSIAFLHYQTTAPCPVFRAKHYRALGILYKRSTQTEPSFDCFRLALKNFQEGYNATKQTIEDIDADLQRIYYPYKRHIAIEYTETLFQFCEDLIDVFTFREASELLDYGRKIARDELIQGEYPASDFQKLQLKDLLQTFIEMGIFVGFHLGNHTAVVELYKQSQSDKEIDLKLSDESKETVDESCKILESELGWLRRTLGRKSCLPRFVRDYARWSWSALMYSVDTLFSR